MPQISERLIAVCDELNFPLIKMPIHVSYYEVLTAIIDKLLAHKVHTLEGIIQVYEAFNTQLMNIEEDYSSLLAMLGNMIGAPLAFFNHNQKCIYSSWGRESDALLKEIFCQSRSLFSNLSDIPKTPVPLTVAGKQYLVRPVHSNNTYYGVLIIETSEYPLTGLMNFYIKQTCQALCIILLNSERQDKYRKRLRYEYLYDLLLGNLGDRMQILSQGRSLDYQIAGVDRVLVVSPTGCEQSSGFQPLQRLEAQIPHVFPSSIPIIMTEPLELVLLSTGKKPKDLAYMGRWISALLLSENMESLVGVSSSCGGPEKIAACYQEAQQAVRISRQLFSQSSLPYVFYDDVKIFALLQSSIKRKKAADVYLDAISQVVSGIQLEETGGIFLVDARTDTIIGHRDSAMTGEKLGELQGGIYAYAGEQILAGKTGLSIYDKTYVQVERVPGSDWVAVAYVSQGEVLQELSILAVVIAVLALAALLLMALLVVIQVRRVIGRPVRELSRAATRIAEGELEQSIQYSSRDELGVLADNFNRVTIRLRDYVRYINEIAQTLHEIAGGNLTFTLQCEYTGEFAKIKDSLEDISQALNGTMGQLRIASRDVAAGAEQVSNGSMVLSQGSTEQAAAVEALAGHIDAVSNSVHQIAQGAQEANRIAQAVKGGLLDSDGKMRNLTEVIQNISDKSSEIHKIVKTIEDIAFQTNILALNAAVEAARAGAAGRGFAVVADEVRNLAGKSSNAARETTVLLNQTVEIMGEGVCAAQDTAQSMLSVVEQADQMSGLISGIADYTRQQAANAEEITSGIGEISTVVQSNVATAEASAAASEELSGQASMLREMVAKFRLKE